MFIWSYGSLSYPNGKATIASDNFATFLRYLSDDLADRDKTTVEGRLDAVQEMLETEDMYHAIAKCSLFLSLMLMVALKGFQDFDRLLTTVCYFLWC